ncbi:MAG: hypothetical protein LUF85_09355 [Bacteroides sp.]|nr:hypothetical protein [Bacteroides sp.]
MNKEQYDYLMKHYFKSNEVMDINQKYSYIDVNDELSLEIQDWAQDELVSKGFNENYELNSIGKIIEEIFDIFSTEE